MQMFYDKDADMSLLRGKTIAIIGFGSQGHAQAQNLRDSGFTVIVAEKPGTRNYQLAKELGFEPLTAAEATKKADIVQMLVPDHVQPVVYRNDVEPNLRKGMSLVFSHGCNIHYGQIIPPAEIDVYMVAPKGPGHLVRRVFESGGGVPSLIAVEQNPSGKAREVAIAHACGIGAGRAGIIETTFAEETETDLFGEQVVLCGGLTELIRAGFETLVEAGYQPEIAYFECLHEVKLIVDLIYEGGIANMRRCISDTAQYGDLVSGPRIINDDVREEMWNVLSEIQSGEFAREWILENQAGRPVFRALKKQGEEHMIEEVGRQLRSMMSWLHK